MQTDVELLPPMTSQHNGCPYIFVSFFITIFRKLIETCRLCFIYVGEDIKNNAWVTVNNDFLVKSEVICQWFSLANHITSDQKIVIHGNKCIILFLTRYYMLWTHNSTKNNHRSLIFAIIAKSVFFCISIVTSSQLICDVKRTSIVTSYSSIFLACANWHEGDLH